MKCAEVFRSLAAWRKLSSVPMKPRYALSILRYTKLVSAEYDNIEKLRVALAYRVSGAESGSMVEIAPDTPEAREFAEKFSEILQQDADIAPIHGISLDEIIGAMDGKEDSLTVTDLAMLEPFFSDSSIGSPKPDGDCSE